MTGYLRVSPEKLQQTAGAFAQKAAVVTTLAGEMAALASSLSGVVWTGAAQIAYTGKLTALQDDIGKINRMIQEHANDLTQMAGTYSTAESANEAMAGALGTNII